MLRDPCKGRGVGVVKTEQEFVEEAAGPFGGVERAGVQLALLHDLDEEGDGAIEGLDDMSGVVDAFEMLDELFDLVDIGDEQGELIADGSRVETTGAIEG
jgi:hypothetical protein